MLSIFNVSKTINEVTWVYNILTASFIKMETELWNSLPDNSDKELIETLVKQGILVNDNNNEIQKYKYFYYNKIFDKTFLSLSVAPTMECRQCKVLPICGGGCPIDRKKGENKGQKSYCSIYKKYIEEMLPLIYENQNRNSKL